MVMGQFDQHLLSKTYLYRKPQWPDPFRCGTQLCALYSSWDLVYVLYVTSKLKQEWLLLHSLFVFLCRFFSDKLGVFRKWLVTTLLKVIYETLWNIINKFLSSPLSGCLIIQIIRISKVHETSGTSVFKHSNLWVG